MKKYLFLSIITLFCINLAFANDTPPDILDIAKQMNVELLQFSSKMYSCTPYKQQLTSYSHPVFYEVVGVEGNTCHVNKSGVNCYYPKDVAQSYAYKKIQDYKKNIDNITRNQSYSSSSVNTEYYNKMDNQYCKYN